jgi:hypothetical protein
MADARKILRRSLRSIRHPSGSFLWHYTETTPQDEMMAGNWIDALSRIVPFVESISRTRRMRRQLYQEISDNYQNTVVRIHTCTSIAGFREGAPLRFAEKLNISFKAWNFYNDPERQDWLFKARDAASIGRVYEKFTNIGNDQQPGQSIVRAKEAAAEVDDLLLDGSLDRDLYRDVSTPDAWRCMDDLLCGRRKSWRTVLNPF